MPDFLIESGQFFTLNFPIIEYEGVCKSQRLSWKDGVVAKVTWYIGFLVYSYPLYGIGVWNWWP